MSNILLEASVLLGTYFDDAIRDAKMIAEKTGARVKFSFNGILMVIDASTNIQEMKEYYEFEIKRMRNMEVTKNE